MRAYLQRVATGPELSKPLSRAAAADAMTMLVQREVDPVQAGIYLIALRMKRETAEENLGSLDALLNLRERHAVDCARLVNIADPFNGYARSVPATPFLAPVLAACGLNAYSHGVRAVGPKYGVTHHQVYAAAGIAVDLSPAEAAQRIADEQIGWSYIDQASYLPRLHDLVDLRAQMVKRSCITTLEVALGPLRAAASGETHLMTGYVHKEYPPVYVMLAKEAGYDGAMIVRGVEGGCIPSLSQPSRFFRYDGGGGGGRDDDGDESNQAIKITPEQAGITQPDRMIPIPPHLAQETPVYPGSAQAGIVSPVDAPGVAAHCAELGKQALSGQPGAMRDSLIYATAICLTHCAQAPNLPQAAKQARKALDTGSALARFEAARG